MSEAGTTGYPDRPSKPSSDDPESRAPVSDVTIQVLVMLAVLIALVAITGIYDPNFFGQVHLRSIAREVSILSLYAMGQAVVIIAGGIDLSVGSFLCFSGVLTCMTFRAFPGIPVIEVVVLIFAVAIVVGLIHGLLVCLLDLQPFLVTLCSLLIFRGLSRVITGDSTQFFEPKQQPFFTDLGFETIFGIPIAVYVLLGAMIPVGFFMQFTVPGRYMYAIGSNLEAARFSGVRVNTLRIFSYILCLLLTCLASFIETSSVGSVKPSSAGTSYEMFGITAAVLGGCSLRGGQGSLIGVVVGATMIKVVRSAVIFLDVSTYWTFVVTGLFLLAAVITDSLVKRRGGRT